MHKVEMTAEAVIEKKKEYLLPCLYHFYKHPPAIARGHMQYLYDTNGKRYTDFYAGVSVMNCGHCNDSIVDAAIAQMKTLQHTTTIYLTEPITELAERLIAFLDCSLSKAFFVNSGTEANEGAILLSKLHTGRHGVIALCGGLHGRTSLAMQVTGIPMWRTEPERKDNVYFAPRPHCHDCQLGKTFPSCEYACVQAVDDILNEHDNVAAMIAEPIQGNGGIIVPPPEYFQRLKYVLEAHGVLLILDEVQTGCCRSGETFCFKHFGIEPDILTTAKALGNGFPVGVFVTNNAIAQSYTKPGASTTGGNPVTSRAACAVLDYMKKQHLAERANELGAYLKERFNMVAEKYQCVEEVRGMGLMLGMELAHAGEPFTTETDLILERLKDRGFLIGKTGLDRNVLTFQPPLIITEDNCDALIFALNEELEAL